ncbi:hypothetical protein BJ944DRAFT_178472 [Cunninghamella echinulata]|nr:hypothetical protein BJ944DRAFT_178472 [Cunninghamella echinulata]
MKSVIFFTVFATLAITSIADVPELNDMYIHHHPSQAKKLAMAANVDNDQGPPTRQAGPIEDYGRNTGGNTGREGYYFREGYDNRYEPPPRSPYTVDGTYRPGPPPPPPPQYRASYNNDYNNYYYPPYRKNDYQPYGEGNEDRGPVVDGEGGGSDNNDGVKYTSNGGIDWTSPVFNGKVQVDRGYDDKNYDPSRNLKMASTIPPEEGWYTGNGFYFDASQRKNSCGIAMSNYDLVGALNSKQFGEKNQNNPNCGKEVTVIGSSGQQVNIKIIDGCDTCSEGDIDLSPAAFEKISQFSHGQTSIKWKFA